MMAMSVVTSRMGPSLGRALCGVLPSRYDEAFAARIARWLVDKPALEVVRGLRANQAMALGVPETHPNLKGAVQDTLTLAILGYLDLFRLAAAGKEAAQRACTFTPAALRAIERARSEGRGLILAGSHTAGFDILLLGLLQLFPSLLVLSGAGPTGSSVALIQLRRRLELDITPISFLSLRRAAKLLDAGGVVAIAADSPVASGASLEFFGRAAYLPTGHARLALLSGSGMAVGHSQRVGSAAYLVQARHVPRPAAWEGGGALADRWAQAALRHLEAFIRERPAAWVMPTHVWPDASV